MTARKTSAALPKGAHRLTGESGRVYDIRLRGIGSLLEFGDLPNDLLDLALADMHDTLTFEDPRAEDDAAVPESRPIVMPGSSRWVMKAEEDPEQKRRRIVAFAQYQRALVADALVEPAFTYDELTTAVKDGTFPEDDLIMLASIVQRTRDRDAKGVKVGVEPLDRWATFRDKHSCGPDCEACQAVVAALSSTDVGAV